jgi:hypothetical protein
MSRTEKSFREYYKSGQYKNFYKLKERGSPLTGQTHLTFTNGIKKVFASGQFTEEALEKIFAQIDSLYLKRKSQSFKSKSLVETT